jgi:hypothetical protein
MEFALAIATLLLGRERMKMSFRTQRILEKIQDKDFVDIASILEIFENDSYLPNNSSDAYRALKLMTRQKYLTKVKQGLYKVENAFIKKELGAL